MRQVKRLGSRKIEIIRTKEHVVKFYKIVDFDFLWSEMRCESYWHNSQSISQTCILIRKTCSDNSDQSQRFVTKYGHETSQMWSGTSFLLKKISSRRRILKTSINLQFSGSQFSILNSTFSTNVRLVFKCYELLQVNAFALQ